MPIETQGCNLYFDCDNNQLDLEQMLRMVIKKDGDCAALSIVGSGGGGLPVGLATEAKQDAMISELMKDSDFEIACVKDINTDVHYFMRMNKDITDGTITIDYVNAQGAVVVPPFPGDLVVCNPDSKLTSIINELILIKDILQDIDDNTDGLETIANAQLLELQAININTDGIEALLTAGNLDTAAILLELQGQTTQLGTIITNLATINTSIQTADTNNVTELQAIQVQLAQVIAELQDINANTAPLEASLTAIENAINTQSGLQITELQTIVTNTGNTVTELVAVNTALASIEGQFTGTTTTTRIDISGVAAQVVPGATYKALQLIVVSGTVSDGTITYPAGTYEETAFANKTLSGVTFNGTGAVAYLKLMS